MDALTIYWTSSLGVFVFASAMVFHSNTTASGEVDWNMVWPGVAGWAVYALAWPILFAAFLIAAAVDIIFFVIKGRQ